MDQLLDYQMSEKFGLDWKKYDNGRMRYLSHIMKLFIERNNKLIKPTNGNKKSHRYTN